MNKLLFIINNQLDIIPDIYLYYFSNYILYKLIDKYVCYIDNIHITEYCNSKNVNYIHTYNINEYIYIIKYPITWILYNNINICSLLNDKIYTNKNNYIILPYKYISHYNNLNNNIYNTIEYENIIYKDIIIYKEINIIYNDIIDNINYINLIYKSVSFAHTIINKTNINDFRLLFHNTLNIVNKLIIDYNNINYTCLNYNLVKSNTIAICIIGQVRTLMNKNVQLSFKKYIINELDKKKINYHLFFLIENKMEYYWQQKLNKDNYIYHIDKNKIINIINNITPHNTIIFYKFNDIIKEIPLIDNIGHTLQSYLFYKIYIEYIIPYQKNNNIKFDYIIKTRPDAIYNYKCYDQLIGNLYKYDFLWQSDIIYVISYKYYYLIKYQYLLTLFPAIKIKLMPYLKSINSSFFLINNNSIDFIDLHRNVVICATMNNINKCKILVCGINRPDNFLVYDESNI